MRRRGARREGAGVNRNRVLRRAVQSLALAVVAGSATFVCSPASRSAPAFSTSDVDGIAYTDTVTPGCTSEQASTTPINNLPVAENGPATTAEQAGRGTIRSEADPTDVIKVSSSINGRARVASSGASRRLIELRGTGRVAAEAAKQVSTCHTRAYSYLDIDTKLTVSEPSFVIFSVTATPFTYVDVGIRNDADNFIDYSMNGQGTGVSGEHSVFLPPGEYVAYLQIEASLRTRRTIPSTPVSGTLRAQFVVAGSRTSGPDGKATAYVRLPSARSCSTGTVDVALTPRRKRVARIAKVKYLVDGKVARVVRRPTAGKLTRLAVPATSTAGVRAVVTERKRRNGRPGKVSEVRADYAACS